MPISELEPLKIPIKLGGKNVYLRYNLIARMYLEKQYDNIEKFMATDSNEWKTEDVIQLLRAGLIDCYTDEAQEKAIDNFDFSSIKPSVSEVARMVDLTGVSAIVVSIVNAIVASLPNVPEVPDENFPPAEKSTIGN